MPGIQPYNLMDPLLRQPPGTSVPPSQPEGLRDFCRYPVNIYSWNYNLLQSHPQILVKYFPHSIQERPASQFGFFFPSLGQLWFTGILVVFTYWFPKEGKASLQRTKHESSSNLIHTRLTLIVFLLPQGFLAKWPQFYIIQIGWLIFFLNSSPEISFLFRLINRLYLYFKSGLQLTSQQIFL
jgi:hypothetical protein